MISSTERDIGISKLPLNGRENGQGFDDRNINSQMPMLNKNIGFDCLANLIYFSDHRYPLTGKEHSIGLLSIIRWKKLPL
jgi:hypothetical protein